MEPISAIAISLALGASAAAGTEIVNSLVRDAYGKLKDLVKGRYPRVSVDLLELALESQIRRAMVVEDLAASGAGQDVELLAAAHMLTQLIEQHTPGAANAIGVDLKDVSAANVCLHDIVAAGTGVKIERGTFTGDINVRGVRSGIQGNEPKKS